MSTALGIDDSWQRLASSHPWPDRPPHPEAPVVGRHSSGFDLALAQLDAVGPGAVVMEIGAEFGGSTRRFLDHRDDCRVISVDPWPDEYGSRSFPELKPYFRRPGVVFGLFQTFCWEHRDRLIALRATSPAGPVEVRDAGVRPDVVYIDGDHRYDAVIRDITVADALFPDARICGDDWSMTSDRAKYEGMRRPVRRAVISWAAFHDVHIEVEANTWALDRSRPFDRQPPPARFTQVGAGLDRIDRRLTAIESAVTRRSLPRRVLGRARRELAARRR